MENLTISEFNEVVNYKCRGLRNRESRKRKLGI